MREDCFPTLTCTSHLNNSLPWFIIREREEGRGERRGEEGRKRGNGKKEKRVREGEEKMAGGYGKAGGKETSAEWEGIKGKWRG